jgi:cytochrome c oxidase subunit 4
MKVYVMTNTPTQKKHGRGPGLAHIMSFRMLVIVWLGLMVLTVLTVAAIKVDLGAWNLYLAMAIATVKATLVALYFMHLRYDKPFNAIVFLSALAFVLLFVSIILTDTVHYQPDIQQYQESQTNP